MLKGIAIFLFVVLIGMQGVYASNYENRLLNKGVRVVYSQSVDTSFPTWFQPSYSQDIYDWLSVLPYAQDRNKDQYIVLPSLGLIAPIGIPTAGTTPGNFNYNSYLQSGVALYPQTGGVLGGWGNSVIFGHSSDYKSKPGRYKTIFSVLPLLDKADEVWLFKKQSGEYKLYRYSVLQSYETHPYDSFVTKYSTRKLITLFTCTDIGTAKNRWLIKAEMIEGDTYIPYQHPKKVSIIHTKKIISKTSNKYSVSQTASDSIFDTID